MGGGGPNPPPPTGTGAGEGGGGTVGGRGLGTRGRGGEGAPVSARSPAGAAAAGRRRRGADGEQHKATEMIGAELGYRYVGSPLIAAEPGEGPKHDFMTYVATTWPGARLPHVWLDDGSAMQDRIGYGHGYTLLRLGGT